MDAAEVVEGVVDDARVEEPDAEAELIRVADPDTEAEADPDTDLEARLGSEGFIEGRRLTQTLNHYHSHSQTPLTTPSLGLRS